jgi:DDE superfamily endonuclease
VIADNLKTHTSAGSLLVRSMLTELREHLRLVYTPAYDPDANRIEWLWRVSRRVVTHNHHRRTFELLLADLEAHFQTLARTPDEVLRHIGSPFAPDKKAPLPLTHAGSATRKHLAGRAVEDALFLASPLEGVCLANRPVQSFA